WFSGTSPIHGGARFDIRVRSRSVRPANLIRHAIANAMALRHCFAVAPLVRTIRSRHVVASGRTIPRGCSRCPERVLNVSPSVDPEVGNGSAGREIEAIRLDGASP